MKNISFAIIALVTFQIGSFSCSTAQACESFEECISYRETEVQIPVNLKGTPTERILKGQKIPHPQEIDVLKAIAFKLDEISKKLGYMDSFGMQPLCKGCGAGLPPCEEDKSK